MSATYQKIIVALFSYTFLDQIMQRSQGHDQHLKFFIFIYSCKYSMKIIYRGNFLQEYKYV